MVDYLGLHQSWKVLASSSCSSDGKSPKLQSNSHSSYRSPGGTTVDNKTSNISNNNSTGTPTSIDNNNTNEDKSLQVDQLTTPTKPKKKRRMEDDSSSNSDSNLQSPATNNVQPQQTELVADNYTQWKEKVLEQDRKEVVISSSPSDTDSPAKKLPSKKQSTLIGFNIITKKPKNQDSTLDEIANSSPTATSSESNTTVDSNNSNDNTNNNDQIAQSSTDTSNIDQLANNPHQQDQINSNVTNTEIAPTTAQEPTVMDKSIPNPPTEEEEIKRTIDLPKDENPVSAADDVQLL